MPDEQIHLSDQPGGVESSGFQLQLRRLGSLQTLMSQGGHVVGEVAQFLARAREEVEALQREQQSDAATHQHLIEEKGRLLLRVEELERASAESEMTIRGLEGTVATLREQLDAQRHRLDEEARVLAARSEGSEAELDATRRKVSDLEIALQRERDSKDRAVARARHEETTRHGKELALVRERLSAAEQQLAAERSRRSRLMEVVRTHDVAVAAVPKQREFSA